MRNTLMAGASSFAHLLGRGAKVAKAAEEDEDDKRKSRRAVSDEDDEKGDGDDEGDGPKDGKSKKGKRAEGPEKDDDEKDDERDDEEDDAKKSKKAKAKRAKAEDDEGDDGESGDEEGDDDSDGADMRKKGARSTRLRERARCSAIFTDAAAGKNPALAAQLAFGTDLPRTQAINVLRAGGLAVAPAPRRPSLDERMAAVKVPVIGTGDAAPPTGAQGLAAQIVAAGRKRRSEV